MGAITTTTTAIAAAKLTHHLLFHHPLFTPKPSTFKKNLSLPLLKTHLSKHALFSSYCHKPLYCSAKETVELHSIEQNEQNPDRKFDNFEEKEVPKLTVNENKEINSSYHNESVKETVEFELSEGNDENPDRKLGDFEEKGVPKLTINENEENPLGSWRNVNTTGVTIDPKLGNFEEREVPKLTVKENEENPDGKLGNFVEREVPKLTVKEKKEICSYANSLGDKLKSQQVGKSGVTSNVVFAFDETLEANELLKLKIHRTCPGELEDVVDQLERATGSVVVGQIGRTVIFYRPSITKLEAEKKKEQARKLFAQKRAKAQAAFMKREQVPRRTGRGQFTSRRSEKISS